MNKKQLKQFGKIIWEYMLVGAFGLLIVCLFFFTIDITFLGVGYMSNLLSDGTFYACIDDGCRSAGKIYILIGILTILGIGVVAGLIRIIRKSWITAKKGIDIW